MVWVLLTSGFWEKKLISSEFDGDKDANEEVSECCTVGQRDGNMAVVHCPKTGSPVCRTNVNGMRPLGLKYSLRKQ
jgi:hypothetical protein